MANQEEDAGEPQDTITFGDRELLAVKTLCGKCEGLAAVYVDPRP